MYINEMLQKFKHPGLIVKCYTVPNFKFQTTFSQLYFLIIKWIHEAKTNKKSLHYGYTVHLCCQCHSNKNIIKFIIIWQNECKRHFGKIRENQPQLLKKKSMRLLKL